MDSHHPPRKQTAHGKEATSQVLFTLEDTEFLVVWRMDRRPHGLLRYLVRPRTRQHVGELMEVDVLPSRAPLSARKRLEEEVQLVSRLSHPAIARVHGLHEHEGEAFLLKEHVEGCNLDTVINFGVLRGRCMTEAFCLYVASEVAGALHAAHTAKDERGQPLGIIHRSVNPGSIRVGLEGTVKLMDFASAYSLLPGRLRTPKGLVRGEIDYAAPERLLRQHADAVDARADLFSLGMVLLELLTGHSLYGLERVERAARDGRRMLTAPTRARAELPSWASVGEMALLAAAFRPEHVEAATREVSAPVRAPGLARAGQRRTARMGRLPGGRAPACVSGHLMSGEWTRTPSISAGAPAAAPVSRGATRSRCAGAPEAPPAWPTAAPGRRPGRSPATGAHPR